MCNIKIIKIDDGNNKCIHCSHECIDGYFLFDLIKQKIKKAFICHTCCFVTKKNSSEIKITGKKWKSELEKFTLDPKTKEMLQRF